jgi:hypothetical protein
MQDPKHVGFVNFHGSLMAVVVSDEMPVPYGHMLTVTSKEFDKLQSSILPVPPIAVIEEGISTVGAVVELKRTDRFPPEANEWIGLAPGVEVVFGCPRCGVAHTIKCPPFHIGVDGEIQPSCCCTQCGMHRSLKLKVDNSN